MSKNKIKGGIKEKILTKVGEKQALSALISRMQGGTKPWVESNYTNKLLI